MKKENVIKRFEKISGLDKKDILRWSFLCEDAISYIRSILKDTKSESKNSSVLEKSAAAYAFYLYSVYAKFDDVKNFKAGDVDISVDTEATAKKAEGIWKNEKQNIASLVFIEDFCFRRVK